MLLFILSAQVKSEYAQLKETLGAVTQERDLAVWEKNQLQGKLENLEQVLKVRKWTVLLSILSALLLMVVHLSWGSNSGFFLPFTSTPSSTCATLPSSDSVRLYCLMSSTCLLPSSVVLGGLARSCERVRAWSTLPPFLPYFTLLCCPTSPELLLSSFPLAPSTPARFTRYHCYVHLLGAALIIHILMGLCPPKWLCLSLSLSMSCLPDIQMVTWS